jgi:hypothetical protein
MQQEPTGQMEMETELGHFGKDVFDVVASVTAVTGSPVNNSRTSLTNNFQNNPNFEG